MRSVCRTCNRVFYENPRVVSGCLVTEGSHVLLCKRAIEPRKGFWTFPAGFLERNESSQAGAVRETFEEANAQVQIKKLYVQWDLIYLSQIYQFFLSELTSDFEKGVETLDVSLFQEETIPWDQLAFPVVRSTLEYYFKDRINGSFPFRYHEIESREYWN